MYANQNDDDIIDLTSRECRRIDGSPISDEITHLKKDLNIRFFDNQAPLFDAHESFMIQQDHGQLQSARSDRSDSSKFNRMAKLKQEIQELKDEEIKHLKQKRICCCLPTTRRGKTICLFLFLFILSVIGTIVYFVYPRQPVFVIDNLSLVAEVKPDIQRSGLDFRVRFPLKFTVTVDNPNYYIIKTEKIKIKAYISPNMTELRNTNLPGSVLTGNIKDHYIGGSVKSNLEFPSKASKEIEFLFYVDFSPNPSYGTLNDPAVGEMARICSEKGKSTNQTVRIVYNIDVEIGFFSRIGITPKMSNTRNIGCPLPRAMIDDFLKNLPNN